MKLYVVRHGQSVGNETETHQDKDAPLSDIGIFQARYVAKRFKKISIDCILSSPFERAKKTAEIIKKEIKKEIIFDNNLRERKGPSEFLGKRYLDPSLYKAKKLIMKNVQNPTWHYSDEENMYDLYSRAKTFLSSLEKRKENSILAVTHGIFARILYVAMMNTGGDELKVFTYIKYFMQLENTGITLYEKDKEVWKLLTWNDYAHLG